MALVTCGLTVELPLPTLAVVIVFMSSFCSSDVTDVTLIRCSTGDVTRYQKDVGSVTDVTLIFDMLQHW